MGARHGRDSMERRFGRYTVGITSRGKILFPEDGITKGDLIDYYDGIASHLVPWLRRRPLVLERYPDGIGAEGFRQQRVGEAIPAWVSTIHVEAVDGEARDMVDCHNRATLVQLAQLGCVTLHPWLSRRDQLDHPDQLIIDIDPETDDFDRVREAAHACRRLFDELELPTYLKTTGSRGVHLVVPLDRRSDFDVVRAFARAAADLVAARHPESLTTEHRKARRKGRTYLDVARNAYGQTAVAPYSVRPLPGAPVATPIEWEELGRVEARTFTIANVRERLSGREDPWSGMARRARGIASARRRLDRLRADRGAEH